MGVTYYTVPDPFRRTSLIVTDGGWTGIGNGGTLANPTSPNPTAIFQVFAPSDYPNQTVGIIPSKFGTAPNDWPMGWSGLSTNDIVCSSVKYTGLVARSDRRLKNTINSIKDESISKLLSLNPVTYYWNSGEDHNLQYGLIAQDVEKVFPEMVTTGTDNMQIKSINYQALHALSLKAIQMLNEKNTSLQQQIDELKKEIEALKK